MPFFKKKPDLKTKVAHAFQTTSDLRIIEIHAPHHKATWTVAYLHGMVNSDKLEVMLDRLSLADSELKVHNAIAHLQRQDNEIQGICDQIRAGNAIFEVSHSDETFVYLCANIPERAHDIPLDENSIFGSKVAFTENGDSTIRLIRSHYQKPTLTIESFQLGINRKTKVDLVYDKDTIHPDVVTNLRHRLQDAPTELITNGLTISKFLHPEWRHLFPGEFTTIRTDRCVSGLAEGRAVIVVHGFPKVLIVPTTLFSLAQSPDDYDQPIALSFFFRMFRFIGVMITLFTAPLYIVFTSVNHEILRVQLMMAIGASREGIPYPPIIEVMIMLILMEMINEAIVRLPNVIGNTATIVGGLIIGQAAAQSHLVSNIMIVVTAVTAIGSFTFPDYRLSYIWRILMFALCLVASVLGIYGVMTLTCIFIIVQCHRDVLGIPYLMPLSTRYVRDVWNDTFFPNTHKRNTPVYRDRFDANTVNLPFWRESL